MTYDEGQIKRRGWLKLDWLAVTNSLRSIFEDLGLPPREQERLAFIQNKVLTTAEEGEEGRLQYISSRWWKGKCGDGYKRYIEMLEDWGQLDSIHSYRASHDDDAFPMPYWIPRPALTTGLCRFGIPPPASSCPRSP